MLTIGEKLSELLLMETQRAPSSNVHKKRIKTNSQGEVGSILFTSGDGPIMRAKNQQMREALHGLIKA